METEGFCLQFYCIKLGHHNSYQILVEPPSMPKLLRGCHTLLEQQEVAFRTPEPSTPSEKTTKCIMWPNVMNNLHMTQLQDYSWYAHTRKFPPCKKTKVRHKIHTMSHIYSLQVLESLVHFFWWFYSTVLSIECNPAGPATKPSYFFFFPPSIRGVFSPKFGRHISTSSILISYLINQNNLSLFEGPSVRAGDCTCRMALDGFV